MTLEEACSRSPVRAAYREFKKENGKFRRAIFCPSKNVYRSWEWEKKIEVYRKFYKKDGIPHYPLNFVSGRSIRIWSELDDWEPLMEVPRWFQ